MMITMNVLRLMCNHKICPLNTFAVITRRVSIADTTLLYYVAIEFTVRYIIVIIFLFFLCV